MILVTALRVAIGFTATLTIFFLSLPLIAIVKLIAKYSQSDLLEKIQYLETNFAVNSPQYAVLNIMSVNIFGKSMNVEKLQKGFKERVLNSEDIFCKFLQKRLALNWKFFMGYAFWRKTDFKLENHIREYDYEGSLELPSHCEEKDLLKIFPALFLAPWKEDQSPWELLVVSNYQEDLEEGNLKTAVIFRSNHVLLDGRNCFRAAEKIFDFTISLPAQKLSQLREISFYQKCLLWTKLPYDYFKEVERMRKRNPFGFNVGEAQDLTVTISGKISTEDIKSIREHYGVSHGAVLHAIFNGALEKMLEAQGNIPIPEELTSIYAIPAHGEAKVGMGNHYFITYPRWKIVSDSSKARLKATQKELAERLGSFVPVVNHFMGFLLSNIPISIRGFLSAGAISGVSLMDSNFPMLTIAADDEDSGYSDYWFGFQPFPGIAITNCISGLNGYHRFVTTFDRKLLPDLIGMSNFGKLIETEVVRLMLDVKLNLCGYLELPLNFRDHFNQCNMGQN